MQAQALTPAAKSRLDAILALARQLAADVGKPIRVELYAGNGRARAKVQDAPATLADVCRNHSD